MHFFLRFSRLHPVWFSFAHLKLFAAEQTALAPAGTGLGPSLDRKLVADPDQL